MAFLPFFHEWNRSSNERKKKSARKLACWEGLREGEQWGWGELAKKKEKEVSTINLLDRAASLWLRRWPLILAWLLYNRRMEKWPESIASYYITLSLCLPAFLIMRIESLPLLKSKSSSVLHETKPGLEPFRALEQWLISSDSLGLSSHLNGKCYIHIPPQHL